MAGRPANLVDFIMNNYESRKSSEEQKLELRLGPPCEDWKADRSVLSLGCLPTAQPCSSSKLIDFNKGKKNGFLASSTATATAATVPNSSQKRSAPATVVGWPPIRSFRKNLASSNGPKPSSDSAPTQHLVSDKASGKKPITCSSRNGMFVKINMDGVPIGRKVDLLSVDSYEKLTSAVDQLFRGLLAAQRDPSDGGGSVQNKEEHEKAITTGLLDRSGGYTLVYEDNEGDRMLVGDVPWQMFVSTVKRLRVLRSSELPSLSLGSKQDRNMQ